MVVQEGSQKKLVYREKRIKQRKAGKRKGGRGRDGERERRGRGREENRGEEKRREESMQPQRVVALVLANFAFLVFTLFLRFIEIQCPDISFSPIALS